MTKRLDRLRALSARPNFAAFRKEFDRALELASDAQREPLKQIGAAAFESLLQDPSPDAELSRWFGRHVEQGTIAVTERIALLLAKLERKRAREAERRRLAYLEPQSTILEMRRIVHFTWFNTAGFQSSDAFEVRRSVFRSNQERRFAGALLARFPGYVPLPNYPLDQIVDLDRLKSMVPAEAWRYGRLCRLDAVLVTPVEGDPIAAFELDSRQHDAPAQRENDRLKESLAGHGYQPRHVDAPLLRDDRALRSRGARPAVPLLRP